MITGIVSVFGGTGFLGRRAVRHLACAGWKVRVIARNPFSDAFLAKWNVEFQPADVRNEASVSRAIAGSSAVVNCVSLYVETPETSFQTIHVEGAERIARCAFDTGARRLVHISGVGADPASRSRYVACRGLGEQRVRAAFPHATILRPSVMFGPGGSFLHSLDLATRLPIAPLFGKGNTRLQPVYVEDVAAGITRALSQPATAGATFELGGGAVYTYRQILAMALLSLHRRRPMMPLPFIVWKGLAALASVLKDPPLTIDQVALMAEDNIVTGKAASFAELGLKPRRLEDKIGVCLPVAAHTQRAM